MELWQVIKFEVKERIPTNDWMFWRYDFWFLLLIPAWPFLISVVVTGDVAQWQAVLGGLTAVVLVPWGATILALRRQKKQNWVEPERYSETDLGGGF